MALPQPTAGLVIGYAYLWQDEARLGQEEGLKDRPCVVILSVEDKDGERIVHVVAITHTPPRGPGDAVELPDQTKQRLGLDEARSWIVTTELNRFTWPGPDLQPIARGTVGPFAFGSVPLGILKQVVAQIRERRGVGSVRRG